ncbi:MAG: cobalt-precorrin-5B (C(1))-methyltransferase [Desulfobacteraceae bacterium]|nr:MAG: cobalt-precorrin-5B (C(1))-methyltransferase [Desulfobacteraceae bacterium]
MAKKLRTGFTTGTAAAAAVKGALSGILRGSSPAEVEIALLTGDRISIPVHTWSNEGDRSASCTVIKDAGDDPDITHGAEIGARVTLREDGGAGIRITAGTGIGRVTKPGLELPPGEPAINPGPRKMIAQAVAEVFESENRKGSAEIEIFAPEGERLSKKTLNARLGIIGGISILGTTGLVKPLSHEAYIATIDSAVSVARALGNRHLVLTTGRRSERYAQTVRKDLPEEAFIQIGDFFRRSLEIASERGVERIDIAVFFGKAIKMAQGVPHTHAAKSQMSMERLADWTRKTINDPLFAEKLRGLNTAREAFLLLLDRHPEMIAEVGSRVMQAAKRFAAVDIRIECVIFDYDGYAVYDSGKGWTPRAG